MLKLWVLVFKVLRLFLCLAFHKPDFLIPLRWSGSERELEKTLWVTRVGWDGAKSGIQQESASSKEISIDHRQRMEQSQRDKPQFGWKADLSAEKIQRVCMKTNNI